MPIREEDIKIGSVFWYGTERTAKGIIVARKDDAYGVVLFSATTSSTVTTHLAVINLAYLNRVSGINLCDPCLEPHTMKCIWHCICSTRTPSSTHWTPEYADLVHIAYESTELFSTEDKMMYALMSV